MKTDFKVNIEDIDEEDVALINKLFTTKIDTKYKIMVENKKREKQNKINKRKNKKKLTKHFNK